MDKLPLKFILLLFILFGCVDMSFAQFRPTRPVKKDVDDGAPVQNNSQGIGNTTLQNNSSSDSLGFEHRDDSKDSITISYVYLDSTRKWKLDSSIDDFDKYYSVPSHYAVLGNNGAAARSLVFKPNAFAGFDIGFHAFDIYQYNFEQTKLYNTTKPFTSVCYQLASGKEQMVKVNHTQNLKPDFNVGVDYKLISAPGFFVSQNANHKSYRFFGDYSGKKKRYHATLIYLGNIIRSAENGGVQNADDLQDPNRADRFTVPVNLGGNGAFNNNPFVTTVSTGNTYRNSGLLLKQSFDFGRSESVAINDSDVVYKYYPKFRVQYTIRSMQNSFLYKDVNADSAIYSKWYNINLGSDRDTISFLEKWNSTTHDLSVLQYPNPENLSRFFMAGLTYQTMGGQVSTGTLLLDNLSLKAEFRNLSKNKKWEMLFASHYFLKGYNNGDYDVSANLFRTFPSYKSSVNLFFNHAVKTPAFLFDERSVFNPTQTTISKKENLLWFGGTLRHPLVDLSVSNYIATNTPFFSGYFNRQQYQKTIALVQVSVSKNIQLARKWMLRTECILQKTDEQSPVRVPLLFTRNRLAYEGHFFKNLDVSSGVEVRYYSSYKAYGYSPLVGQFFVQDSVSVNNLPDVSLFAHFKIKSFSAYLRAENLNTANFNNGSFGWLNNNFAAPLYPMQGFMIRFGIQWWFVN